MKKIFYSLILFYSYQALAQTQSKNYIYEQVPNVAVTDAAAVDNLSFYYKTAVSNYSDGLGRPIQQVIQKYTANNNGKDLVQPIVYDKYGREPIKYLPYTASTSDGSFNINAIADQLDFYDGSFAVEQSAYPFAETVFEMSPLNRVLEQGAPGNDWQPGLNHTVKFIYSNNLANEVRLWEVQPNGGAISTGYYSPNTLFKKEIIDENGKSIFEYTDLTGKLICKAANVVSANSSSGGYETYDFPFPASLVNALYFTYYIYDDFGQLVYILPPQACYQLSSLNFSFTETSTVFDNYIIGNHYDARGRVVEKKIPGQNGWNYFVYNRIDLPVLSQTPNMRNNGENNWVFTKYDVLGRMVMTGIYNNSSSRATLQTALDGETDLWEMRNNGAGNVMGYSSIAYPQSVSEVLTVNYYDDYDFDIQNQVYNNVLNIPVGNRTQGLPTGTLVKVLETPDYLLTVNYYDEKGRLIQERKQQINNTWDIRSHQYDFVGQLIKTKRVFDNSIASQLLTVVTRSTYDHSGRKMNSYIKVNNEPEVIMSSGIYNDVGQVIQKNLHYNPQTSEFIQSVDYRHNIRGWLKKINNASCSYDGEDNFDDVDAFGEEIFYNDVSDLTTALQQEPAAQYNGNISCIKWKTKSPADDPLIIPQKMYIYKYDDLDRMTAGYFAAGADIVNSFDQNLNWFDEKLTYDMMGNVLKLERHAADMSAATYDVIDDLTYDYFGTGNKVNYVDDGVTQVHQTGFTDLNSGPDYTYDDNGNLINDLNKNLSVQYNFLNLPKDLNGGAMMYTYDATGRKLAQTPSASAIPIYYIDGFEFEGSLDFVNLKRIMTEEGRVRPGSDASGNPTWFYDYFLKDHLGSVRAVIASEAVEWDYYATMELGNAVAEEQLFYNIPNTRGDLMPGYPPDYTYSPNYKASALNAAENRPIGHAKVLRMMRNETVSINTKYYFEDMLTTPASSRPIPDILTQLSNIFFLNPSNGTSVAGTEVSIRQQWSSSTFTNNSDVTSFVTNAMGNAANSNPYTPQAFLIYLFYKDNFEFVPELSGVQQAIQEDVLGNIAVLNLEALDNGYFYVYVTNESPVDVDFDNLRIEHSGSTLLELNDYYPYGLLNPALSVAPDPIMANSYKFQSKELLMEVNPNTQDFGWRSYDPVLGRWHVQDPAMQFANPYIAMGDNPVIAIDPDGQYIQFLVASALMFGSASAFVSGASAGSDVNILESWMSSAVSGAVGAALAPIGGAGMTFAENLLFAGIEGAIVGGVNDRLKGERFFGKGMARGAALGMGLSALTSANLKNFIKKGKFLNNENMFKSMLNGRESCQDIMDYFGLKGKYDPDHRLWKRISLPAGGFTDVKTGQVIYGDFPFQTYHKSLLVDDHEDLHVNDVLSGKYKSIAYIDELDVDIQYADFEFYAHLRNYKNQGLYPNHGTDIINKINYYGRLAGIYGINISASGSSISTHFEKKWWHFIYRIPRRF